MKETEFKCQMCSLNKVKREKIKMEKIKYSSNATRVMIAEQKGIIVEWAIAASKAVGYPKSFERAINNIKDDLDVLETMILHYATMEDE